jgi:DNA-binding response OmpR family regulator
MSKFEHKRVLVVDDDDDVRAYLETWFSDQGFSVQTARDGNEALRKLQASKPDLITLDIVMPHKTGVKFYREIKKNKEYSAIPVIIISGLPPEAPAIIPDPQPAPEGYLSKPFNQDELLNTISDMMGV